MRLCNLLSSFPLELIKDAEFKSLGLLSHPILERLVYVESEKYAERVVADNTISGVITSHHLKDFSFGKIGVAVTDQPKEVFYGIHDHLRMRTDFYGQHFDTRIASTADIHCTAIVANKNVIIGERCIIGPHVIIHENTTIMDDVQIRAGSVIGTEGFGFLRVNDRVQPIVHAGGVVIHDRVEIQANCCIAKAMFSGNTTIGEETKTDNLVYIAHDVKIGKRCLIAAHASITGSVVIGNDVWVGPSASIAHELVIGDGASISIGAVVTRNVQSNQRVSGNFAIDHKRHLDFIRTVR